MLAEFKQRTKMGSSIYRVRGKEIYGANVGEALRLSEGNPTIRSAKSEAIQLVGAE